MQSGKSSVLAVFFITMVVMMWGCGKDDSSSEGNKTLQPGPLTEVSSVKFLEKIIFHKDLKEEVNRKYGFDALSQLCVQRIVKTATPTLSLQHILDRTAVAKDEVEVVQIIRSEVCPEDKYVWGRQILLELKLVPIFSTAYRLTTNDGKELGAVFEYPADILGSSQQRVVKNMVDFCTDNYADKCEIKYEMVINPDQSRGYIITGIMFK